MMKKIMTGVAAAAIAGSALAIPTQANALAEWVIPTIIATGIGGVMVGSTAANGPYLRLLRAGRAVPRRPRARPGRPLASRSCLPVLIKREQIAARFIAGGDLFTQQLQPARRLDVF